MIKTIHIKLLLIISLSILFGHSALGQNFPTFVATQNVCVNEEVTYTGYGLDGSQLFFDIYESDGSTVVTLGNVLTLADPPVTVMSGADVYYKYEFVNYKWLTPGTYVVKIREVTSSGCEGGNATDLTVVVSPLPDISSLSFNVSTPVCKNTSPVFTVSGLSPATAYSIGYDDNGVSKIVNVTTDGSGSCSLPVDAIDATATYNVESVAFNDGSANCAASPAPSLTAETSLIENTPPTITAPAAISVNVDAGTCGAASSGVTLGTPTTADNCGVASTINDAPLTFPIGNTTVTWTVTDNSGLTATDTQIVTVVDNISPTITAPAAISVNVDAGTCGAASSGVTLGTPTTADNCGVASTINDAPLTFPIGNTTVTWTVTDNSGLTATDTQIVTVVDNISPTITAPADVAVNSDAGDCTASSVVLGTPVTADNCSVASVTSDAPAVFPLGETTVTWTVTDGSGLQATATQKVTVTDNQNPTITAPADVAVNSDAGDCTASSVVLGTPVTSDNCTVASVTSDAPAVFPLGETTVTWTVTDGSGLQATATQKVTVTDNQNPTITAPADVAVNSDAGICTASSVVLGTPVTADNCSVASVTSDAPAVFPLGETTVTWTVTDGSGLQATATQKVTVTDNQNPTITAPADVAVNSDAGICTASSVVLGAPVTADNCSVASVTSDAPAVFPLGETTVTWTVTDGSGLQATATQKVTVTDNQNPTITAPVDVAVNSDAGICTASSVVLGAPVTADNCSVASVTSDASAVFPLGETTVTWTVTDGSGLQATATQKVTVTDNQNPTITAPADVAVNSDAGICTASSVVLGAPVTADNCSVASVTSDAPAVFPLGETTVTWTVTDGSGLQATATQKVTVTDNQNPTITAPADVAVNSDAGICTASSVVLGAPVTADNCSVASVTSDAPAVFPLGETTVTWTVTDGSGLQATATQKVTVTDNQNPTITAPAAISVNVDAGTCGAASSGVTLGTPTTADNCGVASTINDAPLTFPIGNTTVTWTVTDNSGLTATDTQIVTVVDNISPTITAPADVAVNSDAGDCTASSVATWNTRNIR